MTRFLYEVPVVAATATTGTYLAKVGTCAASRGPGSRLVGDPLHGDEHVWSGGVSGRNTGDSLAGATAPISQCILTGEFALGGVA